MPDEGVGGVGWSGYNALKGAPTGAARPVLTGLGAGIGTFCGVGGWTGTYCSATVRARASRSAWSARIWWRSCCRRVSVATIVCPAAKTSDASLPERSRPQLPHTGPVDVPRTANDAAVSTVKQDGHLVVSVRNSGRTGQRPAPGTSEAGSAANADGGGNPEVEDMARLWQNRTGGVRSFGFGGEIRRVCRSVLAIV